MTDYEFRLAERAAIRMKSERRSCSGAAAIWKSFAVGGRKTFRLRRLRASR